MVTILGYTAWFAYTLHYAALRAGRMGTDERAHIGGECTVLTDPLLRLRGPEASQVYSVYSVLRRISGEG